MIINLFIYSIILWLFFIAVSNISKYRDRKYPPVIQAIAHLLTVLFIVFDVIFNVIYGSIVFIQLPHIKRLTLTARLKYTLKTEDGWRLKLALFICRKMVEPFDWGHCNLYDKK